MRSIRWSVDARADLADIDDYYRAIDSDLALRIGRQAVAAARFLAEYPNAGERLTDREVRRWRVVRTPYVLLYRVDGSILRINRVVHAARDWTRFV
jgi:toxin ParE1/3/4